MAYARLYPNQLGVVITHLEMTMPPRRLPPKPPAQFQLERITGHSVERYKALLRRVGENWLWFIDVSDEELQALLSNPEVTVCAVKDDSGEDVGMLELRFKSEGECLLEHIGLIPPLIGKGHGRWLMDQALHLAWRGNVKRVHMSTCTLDHPRALGFYIKAGFTPYKRAVGSFVDPRLRGLLPRDAAPDVPIIEGTVVAKQGGS